MPKFYAHLIIGLRCKNLEKAKRLKIRIEKAVQLPLEVTELLDWGNDSFGLFGFFSLEADNKNEAVFNWLIHLEQLGRTWQVQAPKLYEDFFSFEGERSNKPKQFKVPGLTHATFELTDREFTYYNHAPFPKGKNVSILESELSKKENIVGLSGYISDIIPRTDGIWHFRVYLRDLGRSYVVSENEIESLNKDCTMPQKGMLTRPPGFCDEHRAHPAIGERQRDADPGPDAALPAAEQRPE